MIFFWKIFVWTYSNYVLVCFSRAQFYLLLIQLKQKLHMNIYFLVAIATVTAMPNGHVIQVVDPQQGGVPMRPVYPRTQYNTQYSSTPRVHAGDVSQPSSSKEKIFFLKKTFFSQHSAKSCFNWERRRFALKRPCYFLHLRTEFIACSCIVCYKLIIAKTLGLIFQTLFGCSCGAVR